MVRARLAVLVLGLLALVVSTGCTSRYAPPIPQNQHDLIIEANIGLIAAERVFKTMVATGVFDRNDATQRKIVEEVNNVLNEARANFLALEAAVAAGQFDVAGNKLNLVNDAISQVNRIIARYGGVTSVEPAGALCVASGIGAGCEALEAA